MCLPAKVEVINANPIKASKSYGRIKLNIDTQSKPSKSTFSDHRLVYLWVQSNHPKIIEHEKHFRWVTCSSS